jgi:maltodextrin utilization protein YvdJ
MISINGRIIYSILLFIMSMLLIYLTKPSMIFKRDDNIKSFGINKHQTIISLGVVTILCAIMSFYVFSVIDLIFSQT